MRWSSWRRPRRRTGRWAFTSTFRFAGSAATSATSRFIPTRTPTRSRLPRRRHARSWSCYARKPLHRRAQAEVRLFRRRHAELSFASPQLKALTDRMKALLPWDEAEEVTFEAEPGTLTEQKLDAHPRHRRHAAEPRRREFRRSHPRDQRPRASQRGNRPRLRLRARASAFRRSTSISSPAWWRRRRRTGAQHRQGHRTAARLRDDLPDGGARTTRASTSR